MSSSQQDFTMRWAGSQADPVTLTGFNADDCLLGVIDHGRQRGRSLVIEVDGIGILNADFQQGVYHSNVRSEEDFFTVNPRLARVTQGSQAVEGPGRPLEELLWKAAYYGSSGRLLEGCNLYDVVELKRWPNFTRLPHTTGCLPLCSLLARRPSSIAFAHRMLRVPPDDAMSFFSAARSAGYLRMISAQPDANGSLSHSVSADHDSQGRLISFWGRLFGRLAGL